MWTSKEMKYGDFTSSILQSYRDLSISVNSILEIRDYVLHLCTTLNLGTLLQVL